MRDVLQFLERPDKWYLGAGDGLVWAPPSPVWLETPGFWDEAHLFQYAVRPLFTVSFVAGGLVLEARCQRRRWTPAALTLEYRVGPLRAREVRVAPGGALVSEWEVRNPGRRALALDVVIWTAVDGGSVGEREVAATGGGLALARTVTDRTGHAARVSVALALAPAGHSFAAARSEGSAAELPPRFELTPFFDRWRPTGRLGDRLELGGLTPDGLVFLGVQRRFRLPAGGQVAFGASAALSLAADGLPTPAAGRRPVAQALGGWRAFSRQVPEFRAGDRHLERYWWYRWYGLRLNRVAGGGAPNYAHPSVTEGIGYFHVPISYSAPAHVRELRWLADADWARGVLRTFLRHQRPDGSLHGRIYADHLDGTDFYHGDWGGALAALDAVHPDPGFAREVYPGLARYARWLRATRDADGTGMLDVANQFEAGQEYMSRYQAVDPDADRAGWASGMRLKGVDVTVYGYRLHRVLAGLARFVAPADEAAWLAAAERAARALREIMWDADAGMFSDVNPSTGRRTGVKAAVCFYPYLTDVVGEEHLAGLERHLFDAREFWTPFPVPSSSADDPLFAPDASWKGKRHNCPWNGRVWPMTNSHLIDAVAAVVRRSRPGWAGRLGHFLGRFVRMMTFDGRAERPNCFEHYHPYTGRPSLYRGIDDYQHSWVNDLIVSHVAGVLPRGPLGVTLHPLPLGVPWAELDRLPVAGHRLRVAVRERRFHVWVDGRAAGRGRVGDPLDVAF